MVGSRTRRGPPGQVEFLGSFPRDVPVTGLPEVAFAGRSNVGKSSAINALLGRRAAARVSRTPGRTQAINLFRLDGALCFADLPGYGFARVPAEVQQAWKGLVEGYLADREALRLVVVLVDGRLEAQPLDRELLAGLTAAGIPHLVVATKTDKLGKAQKKPQLDKLARGLGFGSVLAFSARTGNGVAEVWHRIREACG